MALRRARNIQRSAVLAFGGLTFLTSVLLLVYDVRTSWFVDTAIAPRKSQDKFEWLAFVRRYLNSELERDNSSDPMDKKAVEFGDHLSEKKKLDSPTLEGLQLDQSAKTTAQKEMTSELEFRARLERVQEVCARDPPPGNVLGVFPFKTTQVAYCMVPKAGCTFWKKVYLLLSKQPSSVTLEDLQNLPRLTAHSRSVPVDLSSIKGQYPLRLIGTRDPFSRLVSSFLDKVYLPDFWRTEVRGLLLENALRGQGSKARGGQLSVSEDKADFLRVHYEDILHKFGQGAPSTANLNSTVEDRECGKFATFHEFIIAGFRRAEPHWMPIHQICNPCKLNATHISKMDTFTKDARAIFSLMGHDHVLDELDQDTQVDEEIDMIVQYNYDLVFGRRGYYQKCVSQSELAFRLWHNFWWRGYIHPDVKYKVPKPSEVNVKDDLLQQLKEARKKGLDDRGAMKTTKEEFKINLFKTLPKRWFFKLVEKYEIDFQLFDFESSKQKYLSLFA